MDIINSFEIKNESFYYYDITKVTNYSKKLKKLPIVLKILLEANLRKSKDAIEFNKIVNIFTNRMNSNIGFYPSRIIMQDFTGIPALVDLASMRDAVKEQGGDISKVNPQIMVDLVIDNTINLLSSSSQSSLEQNANKQNELNFERYEFAKWASKTFSNFRVVPPGSGICHQVNLEYLSTILHVQREDEKFILYPETIIGTDAHATMINSLGVLAWGVDGIEAEAAMLGHSITLELPKVVGVNIHGDLKEGISSSDLVLTLTNILKNEDVSGKLVEFYGDSLKYLTLEDRSAISNMAPEYGAICSFFAIDDKTITYFNKTRDNEDYGQLLKTYLEKQGLFYSDEELEYDELINFDLSLLEPTIAGPKRPRDSIKINTLKNIAVINKGKELQDADIVIAAITSSISTSNPYLLIHAALIAKKACEFGLEINSNINRSFAPSSLVVKEYLEDLGLLKYLEKLGFHIVGYGCTSYCGNSGDLDANVETDIKLNNLNVASVTSGNRSSEDKIHPLIKSNYFMSPSLVVIYALIGTMKFDLYEDVIGVIDDKDIRLRDLWPKNSELASYLEKLDYTLYRDIYKDIFKGNEFWQKIIVSREDTFPWNPRSTYIQASNFFEKIDLEKIDIEKAGILAIFEDFISTDYISPMGQISLYSQAAKYLESKGVKSYEYNSFGSRRGNAQVMLRAAFDNARVQNLMVSKEGGFTKDYEYGEIISIFEKAEKFKEQKRDLVIFAGSDYGIGTPRNWPAKTTRLLGVKAVIAKSFDENHRKNLINLGVLPLEFIDDEVQSIKLKGNENISIQSNDIKADSKIDVLIEDDERSFIIEVKCRLDNDTELTFYKNGGILSYLLKEIQKD